MQLLKLSYAVFTVILLTACGADEKVADQFDATESLLIESVIPEPVTPEPVTPEPVTPEPVTPEPVTPEPVTPEPVTPEPEPTNPDTNTDPSLVNCNASLSDIREAVLNVINESRSQAQQCGTNSFPATSDLIWDDRLSNAAQRHSEDMAGNNFFDHTGSNGLTVGDRSEAEGYSFRFVGENIAAGYANVKSAHDGLMRSPGHCSNIMSGNYAQLGAACVIDQNTDFRTYWTFVFGTLR